MTGARSWGSRTDHGVPGAVDEFHDSVPFIAGTARERTLPRVVERVIEDRRRMVGFAECRLSFRFRLEGRAGASSELRRRRHVADTLEERLVAAQDAVARRFRRADLCRQESDLGARCQFQLADQGEGRRATNLGDRRMMIRGAHRRASWHSGRKAPRTVGSISAIGRN